MLLRWSLHLGCLPLVTSYLRLRSFFSVFFYCSFLQFGGRYDRPYERQATGVGIFNRVHTPIPPLHFTSLYLPFSLLCLLLNSLPPLNVCISWPPPHWYTPLQGAFVLRQRRSVLSLLCLFCLPNSPNFTSIVFTLPSTVLLVCLFLSYEPSCSWVARHFLRFLFLFNFFAILLACLDPFSNYLLLSLFVSILTMVIAPKRSGTFSHPFMRVSYQLGFPLRGPAMRRVCHHTTGRRNYAPICLCFNIGTPASKSHMAIKTVQSCVSISIFKIFPEYPHVQYKERSVCIV